MILDVGIRAVSDGYTRAAQFAGRLRELIELIDAMKLSQPVAMALADIITLAAREFGENRPTVALSLVADTVDLLAALNISPSEVNGFRLKAREICLNFCGYSPV